jgi:L-serine deaminase
MATQNVASERLLSLIASAAMRAGNEAKLAKLVEANRHNLSAWKAGKRACPIEAQVLMADLTERDVQKEIADALIERNANTPRGEKLVTALGKGLMAVIAVTTITLSANDASASSSIVLLDLLRCILRAFL